MFWFLWTAQLFSLLGTDTTRFALRVWTFKKSGTVVDYALVTVFSELPGFLFAPIIGVLIDRTSRKKVILVSDTVAACSNALLWYLHVQGELKMSHIYIANFVQSICGAFQWPAFVSTVSLMFPSKDISKAASINEALPALSMLIAPIAGGLLLRQYGLHMAFLCEVVTFVPAFFLLLTADLPRPENAGKTVIGFLEESKEAFGFIYKRKGLMALLVYLTLGHFSSGLIQVLTTPLVMAFADESVLGTVLTVSGLGAIVGTVGLNVIGSPNNCVVGVLTCCFLQGFLLAFCGVRESSALVLFVAFTYMALIPVNRVCRQSLWQRKTPANMQGRVFAIQHALAQGALPLASVLAGPLADHVFEPLLADEDSILSNSMGSIIGIGKGRGIAFFFIVAGLCNSFIAMLGYFYKPLMEIETILPDLQHKTANAHDNSKKTS
eukprot:m.65293 g.65293  ORF g.65293 m.65293 type:complete len:437 (+) comp11722_c0_seq2:243-1553(+)